MLNRVCLRQGTPHARQIGVCVDPLTALRQREREDGSLYTYYISELSVHRNQQQQARLVPTARHTLQRRRLHTKHTYLLVFRLEEIALTPEELVRVVRHRAEPATAARHVQYNSSAARERTTRPTKEAQ